jgi:hypothetical protein
MVAGLVRERVLGIAALLAELAENGSEDFLRIKCTLGTA